MSRVARRTLSIGVIVLMWALCAWHIVSVMHGIHGKPNWEHIGSILLYAVALSVFLIGAGVLCLFAVGLIGWILHNAFGDQP